MAMNNICQRYELAYGHRAIVAVDDSGDTFVVSLRFPWDEGEA